MTSRGGGVAGLLTHVEARSERVHALRGAWYDGGMSRVPVTTKRVHLALALVLGAVAVGCGGAQAPANAPAGPSVSAPPPGTAPRAPAAPPAAAAAAQPASAPTIDEKAVVDATGVEKAETSPDGVVKASWPRKDVEVAVDGWKMPPFMGLTSWAAFSPGRQGVAEAMVMGDLVLFEDEVNAVMSTLLDAGLEVTALHNHFFFDAPKVYFMHIGGEGKLAELGKGVKSAMDEVAAIRRASPKPGASFKAPKLPEKSTLQVAKLDAELGTKGQSKDGMYKAVWGRDVTASCGCQAGKAMGVNTWAAFAGSDDNALVDGDFAVAEGELQAVLKALRGGGINVVAIHHHMSGERPRILFLHYWGRGKAVDLASTVKKALDKTAWAGNAKMA